MQPLVLLILKSPSPPDADRKTQTSVMYSTQFNQITWIRSLAVKAATVEDCILNGIDIVLIAVLRKYSEYFWSLSRNRQNNSMLIKVHIYSYYFDDICCNIHFSFFFRIQTWQHPGTYWNRDFIDISKIWCTNKYWRRILSVKNIDGYNRWWGHNDVVPKIITTTILENNVQLLCAENHGTFEVRYQCLCLENHQPATWRL